MHVYAHTPTTNTNTEAKRNDEERIQLANFHSCARYVSDSRQQQQQHKHTAVRSSHRLTILHFLHQLNSNISFYFTIVLEYIKLKFETSISPIPKHAHTHTRRKAYARNKRKHRKKNANQLNYTRENRARHGKKTPPIRRWLLPPCVRSYLPEYTHAQSFVSLPSVVIVVVVVVVSRHTHIHTHLRLANGVDMLLNSKFSNAKSTKCLLLCRALRLCR